MKRHIVFLGILAITGCSQGEGTKQQREGEGTPPPFTVIVIDGCEYLKFPSTHAYEMITHKGNCKNPIHCYVTQIKEESKAQ